MRWRGGEVQDPRGLVLVVSDALSAIISVTAVTPQSGQGGNVTSL